MVCVCEMCGVWGVCVCVRCVGCVCEMCVVCVCVCERDVWGVCVRCVLCVCVSVGGVCVHVGQRRCAMWADGGHGSGPAS